MRDEVAVREEEGGIQYTQQKEKIKMKDREGAQQRQKQLWGRKVHSEEGAIGIDRKGRTRDKAWRRRECKMKERGDVETHG